jgi:hypothetical protein
MPSMNTAEQFLDRTTLTMLLDIDPDTLDVARRMAFDLVGNGAFDKAEVISRGLVAADHRFWYYRTLLAVSLQKLGRVGEAIDQVNEGLKYEPGHPELSALKTVLLHLPASAASAASAAPAAPAAAEEDEFALPRFVRC